MVDLDLNTLAKFITKAKKSTFAEGGNRTGSCRVGSEDYLFEEGEFVYRDSFFGDVYDIGQEIVWKNNKPLWGMNYMGGMKEEYQHLSGQTFRFLKKCLKMVDSSIPYRGPHNYKERDFEYTNKIDGDIKKFLGTEKIFFNGKEIYSRFYHGGLIL